MQRISLRVLLVDDDVDFTGALALLLEMEGHETAAVHDGLAVVEVSRHFAPDVILLDLTLPGIDGFEAASLLGKEKLLDDTLLIGMTGWSTEEHKAAADEGGFYAVLTKPVPFAVLNALLAQVRPLRKAG